MPRPFAPEGAPGPFRPLPSLQGFDNGLRFVLHSAGKPAMQEHAIQTGRLRHVIWDWNGTLLDDVTACVTAINHMLARRGLEGIDTERYRDVFEFPVKRYYRTLGFDLDAEDWDAMAREFHELYEAGARSCDLRAGARACIEQLRARGIDGSVLSASERSILTRMLQQRGLAGVFRHVAGLTDLYAHSKLETGRALLEQIGDPRQSIILVGDTSHDYEVAAALGCRCVLIEGGHQSPRRLRQCDCPVIPSIEDLAPLMA